MVDDTTAGVSLTGIEEEVRRFWKRRETPDLSRTARRGGPPFSIYQEPLLVAGQPWLDQVRLLAMSDLWMRYRAMRGDAVQLRTGWICHGLPVEMAAEQRLGVHAAEGVPAQHRGIAQFTATCRALADEGIHRGERLASWLGLWLDPAVGTFASCTQQAVAAVWGALHRLWEAGKLNSVHDIVPVCPRCATPLSSAEASRHTASVDSRALWVRLPWDGEPYAYFLARIHVPWMLVGMVALAVHPDASYALVELAEREGGGPPQRLLLAESALQRTLVGEFSLVRRLRGKALAGVRYGPPFTFLPADNLTGRIVASKDVPQDEGTGLLALIPAFDAASLRLAHHHGLPVPDMLDDRGRLGSAVMLWRGLSPIDAEPLIIEDLRARGLVFQDESSVRTQGLCPYCHTPLLPLARDIWRVPTLGGSWTISRDRDWGVPLPVWACGSCGDRTCVAGLDELAHRTGLDIEQIDLQRPAVDGLTFPCHRCAGTKQRVQAVVDAAFEAAVLSLSPQTPPSPVERSAAPLEARPPHVHGGPLATTGLGTGNLERTLAIGLDPARHGWLSDVDEVAALLRWPPIAGQKVVLPEREGELAREQDHGSVRKVPADALRWAAYAGVAPEEAEEQFLGPVWRLAIELLVEPVQTGGVEEGRSQGSEPLDRWLQACLYQATLSVSAALDAGDALKAARSLADLVRDLSFWRVQRTKGDGRAAVALLSRLLAPFVPHLAEDIHRRLGNRFVDSVSLSEWPAPDPDWADPDLLADMVSVRQLAQLGSSARRRAGIESARLLPRAEVAFVWGDIASLDRLQPLKGVLAEVLGVAEVHLLTEAPGYLTWRVALRRGQAEERDASAVAIRAALDGLGSEAAAELAIQLGAGLSAALPVEGRVITLLPDEVTISVQPSPGWVAAVEAGQLVVLQAP